MNRLVRRFLLGLATVVFIVVTPAIILYALGFRPAAARVGVLLLESHPARADVFVDGESHGSTPRTISGRGGTTFTVDMKKAGYRSWQKRLPLLIGVTTEARGVRLVPETLTPKTLVANTSFFTLAPNRALLATVDGRTLTVHDEEGQQLLSSILLSAPPVSLLWSPDSTLVLVRYSNNRFDLVSLTEGVRQGVPISAKTGGASLAWDPRTPGRLLFLNPTDNLVAYDIRTGAQQILSQNVAAFAPSAREIILVNTDKQLRRLTLSGGAIAQRDIALPENVDNLIVSPGGHIALLFTDRVAALLQDGALLRLASSVESLGFSPSGDLLYVQTAPNELRVFNIDDERLTHVPRQRLHLITRLSQPISHPQWFAGGQHLMYQLGDQIVLTEIDTRDHVISEVLDSTNLSDAAVAVGEDGESLFYLKRTPASGEARQGRPEDSISLVRTSLIVE